MTGATGGLVLSMSTNSIDIIVSVSRRLLGHWKGNPFRVDKEPILWDEEHNGIFCPNGIYFVTSFLFLHNINICTSFAI